MPLTFLHMRRIGDVQRYWQRKSHDAAPRNGALPIGGGDWMDSFFRSEAIEGLLSSLRKKDSLKEAMLSGVMRAKEAIRVWNHRHRKDYAVQRWDGWVEDFLLNLVKVTR